MALSRPGVAPGAGPDAIVMPRTAATLFGLLGLVVPKRDGDLIVVPAIIPGAKE